MSAVFFVLFCFAIVGIYALRFYGLIGFPSNYTLASYQGGIIYKRGKPVREAGPGRHRVLLGVEKVLFLDKRPVQVNIENRAVGLQDGAIASYGFTASAHVSDVRKALYSSATYTQVPAFVTLCVARRILNQSRVNQVALGRAALEDEITRDCRSRLAAAGFELVLFRFTQLTIVAPSPNLG